MFAYFKVELKEPAVVRGLTTQGRNGCCQQWVTRYRVLYSEDCKHWSTVGGFNVTDAVSSPGSTIILYKYFPDGVGSTGNPIILDENVLAVQYLKFGG